MFVWECVCILWIYSFFPFFLLFFGLLFEFYFLIIINRQETIANCLRNIGDESHIVNENIRLKVELAKLSKLWENENENERIVKHSKKGSKSSNQSL